MNIEQIEKEWLQRCEMLIFHSGNGSFPRPQKPCQRVAAFKIGKQLLCKQHAGDTALKHLLNKQN